MCIYIIYTRTYTYVYINITCSQLVNIYKCSLLLRYCTRTLYQPDVDSSCRAAGDDDDSDSDSGRSVAGVARCESCGAKSGFIDFRCLLIYGFVN